MFLHSSLEISQRGAVRGPLRAVASSEYSVRPIGEWAIVLVAVAACVVAVAATVLGIDGGQVLPGSTSLVVREAQVPSNYRIESMATVQNRLVVSIANEGELPLRGDLAISVDGGPAKLIHGTALPTAGNARIALDEVVQKRAQVTLDVRTADGRSARTISAILAPDVPNDLELSSAKVDGDGVLVAELRNNSPIPLRGTVIVAARDPGFPYTLLARTDAALQVEARGSQEIRVGHVGQIDVGRTWIGLTTDAIEDADIGNDVLGQDD